MALYFYESLKLVYTSYQPIFEINYFTEKKIERKTAIVYSFYI